MVLSIKQNDNMLALQASNCTMLVIYARVDFSLSPSTSKIKFLLCAIARELVEATVKVQLHLKH